MSLFRLLLDTKFESNFETKHTDLTEFEPPLQNDQQCLDEIIGTYFSNYLAHMM